MKGKVGNRFIASLEAKEKPYEVYDTALPGFILRVQPSGEMTYYVRYRLQNGKRDRVRVGPASVLTPAQARDMAKDILANVVKGIDPAEEKRSAKSHTLRSFIDEEYEPWALANRKSGKGTVAVLRFAFKGFLDSRLDEISAWNVEKWRTQRLKPVRSKSNVMRSISKATVNRNLAYLKAAMARAVEWGFLKEHPLASVKLAKEHHSGKDRILTEDEESSLLKALDDREEELRLGRDQANEWRRERSYPLFPDLREQAFADYLKPMVLLSLNTGLRRGEVFDIKWADVDLDRANITISSHIAKSGKSRQIPLNSVGVRVMRDWRKQNPRNGLVFENRQGARFGHVNNAWRSLLNRTKITEFRWHDMRHQFASKLVMAGVDLNTVRELLGHSDIKMTLRYAHLDPKVKADAVEKIVQRENSVVDFSTTENLAHSS